MDKAHRQENYCSDVVASPVVEPLAGSAKRGEVYVLFEWPGGWSHDILDGDTFGPEMTAKLKAKLKGVAGLQLIRRPGKAGRQVGQMHRCYLVFARQAVMEMVLLSSIEQMLDLDLSGPGKNGGGQIDVPLALVCTHAKRDVCCAVKGRPLAAQLDEHFPASMVWETSHVKGHRFAPAVLLMPWGYSFGRLNFEAGREMLQLALEGKLFYPANRGSGLLTSRGQVAELHVARTLIEAGEDVKYHQLTVSEEADDSVRDSVRVSHPDGRTWDVPLVQQEISGVVSSCGDAPKSSRVWVVPEEK